MPPGTECDVASVALAVLVFTLPLTILVPGFSIWNFVPKIHVTRYFAFSQSLTWSELNSILVVLVFIFFCFYLELGKRRLDDMVDEVMNVSQATEAAMQVERGRQEAAIRSCVELLDASSNHYENLMLLRDDLRKREKQNIHHPPTIEPSSSIIS